MTELCLDTLQSSSRQKVVPTPPRGFLKRIVPALRRRLHSVICRVKYPRAHFGENVDIRRRFELRLAPDAVVQIGSGCICDNDMTIECGGELTIGNRTIFGHHCTIAVLERVEIGEDCLIAEMVSIRDHNHCFDDPGVPYRQQGMVVSPVKIGRNVWLGAKVTVARGVTIGDNAVVGANAVVTKDIPANSVAVGVPAKVIRTLGSANL